MINLDLKRPCAKCPFRLNIPGYLRPQFAAELAEALRGLEGFPCHETIDYQNGPEDEEGFTVPIETEHTQMCAGALIALLREDQLPAAAQVAERLGWFDRNQLDMNAPVGTLDEFVEHHRQAHEAMLQRISTARASTNDTHGQ